MQRGFGKAAIIRETIVKAKVFTTVVYSKIVKIGLRRSKPLALPIAVLVTGACLLAYVGSEYGHTWASQHRMREALRAQTSYNLTPANIEVGPRTANGGFRRTTGTRMVDPSLTRLLIPSIGLDAMVVEGTSRAALLAGPGHMEDTAFPGDRGNSIIAGHRDTFFRRLDEVHVGDMIMVQRSGRRYRYSVVSKNIVDADDSQPLMNASSGRLTLITCYPIHYIGPAPRRLVVEAKLVTS